jgi:hypothetical protein
MVAKAQVIRVILVGLVGSVAALACSSSSGPSDTTIVLDVDEVTTPTNAASQAITGTTDPNATVTVTSPIDTVSGPASGSGAFSLTVLLVANSLNDVDVEAVDAAGNRATDAFEILHDNVKPSVAIPAPGSGATTAAQSDFDIDVTYSDGGSGVDLATLEITDSDQVGGVYLQDGTFSTVYAAGSSITPMFQAGAAAANTTVSDSLIFVAGSNQLFAQITDRASNQSDLVTRSFTVGADPTTLVVTNSSGAPGSTGIAIDIGLANADSIAGLQFDFTFDTNIIATVDSVTATGRGSSLDSTPFSQIASGQVRVLLFDSGGGLIIPGQGPVITLWITVDGAASAGSSTVNLVSITVSDLAGGSSGAPPTLGTFVVP